MEIVVFFLLILGFGFVFYSWNQENSKKDLVTKKAKNHETVEGNNTTSSYKHPYSIDVEYEEIYQQDKEDYNL